MQSKFGKFPYLSKISRQDISPATFHFLKNHLQDIILFCDVFTFRTFNSKENDERKKEISQTRMYTLYIVQCVHCTESDLIENRLKRGDYR